VKPRLGFLGVGWIGRHRMECIAKSGVATIAAVADENPEAAATAAAVADAAIAAPSIDDLLAHDLDGLVIATPSALHADQSAAALASGLAVFCQKPLARSGEETWRVIGAARAANRLLGVDLSYRHTRGMECVRRLVQEDELGSVYAVDLTFHNAYGPDKAWFYDRKLSGGGCVIDLGIHLVDLAMWTLDFPRVADVTSRLWSKGAALRSTEHEVEDYAVARLDLETGATITLTCSWNLPAGRDALISASFYGTKGGAALRNVNGSFYDFTAERYRGTSTETLCAPPDDWGGRAAVDWAARLASGTRFDPSVEHIGDVADALDRIYGR